MSSPNVLAAGFSPRACAIGALGTTAGATAMASAFGAAIGAGCTEAGFSAENEGFFGLGAGVMDFGFGAGATDFALAFCFAYCAAGESKDGSDFFLGTTGLVGGLGAKPEARLTACSSGVAERRRGARRGAGAAAAGVGAAAAGAAAAARELRTRGSLRRS